MIPSSPSIQDRRSQIQTVVQMEEPHFEPIGVFTQLLESVEAASDPLFGDALEVVTESRDALIKAIEDLYSLPMKTLNSPQFLEEGAFLSEKEKRDWASVEIGRLIQSPAIDAQIRERVVRSMTEALFDRALVSMHLVAVRLTQSEATMVTRMASKARKKTKLVQGKEGNTESQKKASEAYAEAMKTVYEVFESHFWALQSLTEVAKKYAKTRGGLAKAIDSLVATQTKA